MGIETVTEWTFFEEAPVPDDITGLLIEGEEAYAAFKIAKDFAIFTTKRLIVRNEQGGKKVEIYSLPYSAINMWSSENAGRHFGINGEVELWTRAGQIKIKLGRDVDVRRIDSLLANFVLNN